MRLSQKKTVDIKHSSLFWNKFHKIDFKSFLLQYNWNASQLFRSIFPSMASSGRDYKIFKIVIYDRNDSSQYYNPMILANVVLACSVNCDHKIRRKLMRNLWV